MPGDGSNRPETPWSCQVLYHAGPRHELVRAPRPTDRSAYWGEARDESIAGDWRIGSVLVPDQLLTHNLLPLVPRLGLEINRAYLRSVLPDADDDLINDLVEFSNKSEAEPRAGVPAIYGHAGHLLGELQAFDETTSSAVEGIVEYGVDPVAARVRNDPHGPGDDWIHLLTVRSCGTMEWCDAGFLYFVVRRSHLQSRDFSQVCMSMVTS
jgi:hypothetical protein